MARVCNRGILPILAVAGMILTGCGGGSAKVAAPAPTTTQPGVAPDTPAQRAADKVVAGRAVLKLSDFPLGWTSAPHDKSGSSGPPPAIERKLVACSHLPKRFFDDQADQQPNVDSPDFSKGVVGAGPAARIESSVELDRTVRAISAPLSLIASPTAAKCFGPLFRAEFAEGVRTDPGVSLTGFSFHPLSAGSIGDQSAGFQSRVTIVGARVSIAVELDMYFVRVKRAIVVLTATTFSIPFDQAFAQDLLQKMVARLSAA